ncbi:hypothetical protein AB0I00_20290 [Streptomyces sp. NPDC050803]|uniref:hypothetical protein n=1 Tax=unclassified Streptomyces TaxID=2593676 RepID=UPI003413090A
MSRETDSPSSGPNGRGGAAYPSGTPPYGTPTAPDGGADAGRSAARPEERKTETTLTTRIRINIPGSRPIPPVVVRTPVADAESSDDTAETPAMATPTAEAPAEPAAAAEDKTSDWFAPRKSSAPKPDQGGGQSNGAGLPGGSGAAPAADAGSAPRPGGVVGAMNLPGGSRPGGTNGAGLPGATGGPVAPGHGGGTGSFDVTEALASGPLGTGARPGPSGDEPRRDDLPYFSDNGGPQNGQGGPTAPGGYGGQSGPGAPAGPGGPGGFDGPSGFNGPGGPAGPGRPGGQQGPAGPTTGPVTGDGPIVPPVTGGPGGPGGPGGMAPFGGPGGPGGPAGMGAPAAGRGPGGGLSDDTAILTPQKPAPEPGSPGYGNPADNVSGHTVTSGIPVVPPTAQNVPFGPGAHTDGPLPHTPPKLPEPVAQNVPAAPAPKKKKGRGKLGLLTGGVVVLAGGVYGAGLLMNHSDVPKGTTVLGVDIGGGTHDDAVQKLDAAFEDRVNKALKLSVGGKTVTLKPDQAGLQFDAAATVSEAAKSDYNPVSVVGSLFGQERVVEPVMPVDEEKLQAALESAAGGSGSVTEGTIKFDSGKAVAVYGKPGKGIDVGSSTEAVEEAYRTQVETGTVAPVQVATTTQQPTITNAEVDRMMKEFAEPAMSGNATVQTDAAHSIPFGDLSLPKILGVKAVDGKLVDTYDLEALKEAYGSTFDGVQIQTATGKRGVLPQDVVSALRKALRGKTAAERVAVIDTNPN